MGLFYSSYDSDNRNYNYNNTKINAVSGTLTKTYKDSYFIKEDDPMYELYSHEPYRKVFVGESYCGRSYDGEFDSKITNGNYNTSKYYKHIPITILQIMLSSENGRIYEIIDKEKYDKIFEIKEDKISENN